MNKNVKSIFLVLTLVTLLVTVGAVSAAEDADSTIAVNSSVSDAATVSDTASDTIIAESITTTSNDNTVDTKTIETNIQEENNQNDELITTFSDEVVDIEDDRYNYQTLTLNDNVLVKSSTDFHLTNVAFYVDGNNITIDGLTITNYNNNNNGIVITVASGSSDVNITNNTIYNSRSETGKIQAVFVNSSENVNIIDNTLTVEGIPQALGWYNTTPTKWLSDAKLSGVLVIGSESVNVSNNIITVTNVTSYTVLDEYNTAEGLTIKSGTTNSVFNNNTITVDGSEYVYGISVSEGVSCINITDNNVYLDSLNYICGINLDNITYSNITGNLINGTCLNTSENPIRSNESMAYGINLISQNITIDPETNYINVTDNIINLTSTIAYGIEGYYVEYIKMHDNKINLTANKAMGIAATITEYTNITENKINVTTCNDRTLKDVVEAIQPVTTGIYLIACVDMEGNITGNIINVTETHDNGDIYSIILRSSNLYIDDEADPTIIYGVFENYMSSYSVNNQYDGDNSVDDWLEETEISDNYALNDLDTPASSFFIPNHLLNNKKLKTSLKSSPKTILLNTETYETYITNGYLNDNVSDGDVINITSPLDSEYYSLIIDKPVNITSSSDEYYLNFQTHSTDSYGSYSGGIFKILPGGSNSNITNINLQHTRVSIEGANNLIIDNITVNQGSGSGVGSFSVRNYSNNVNITNSLFLTKNNGGHSNVVFAGANNCLFENNTVIAEGNVGNLIYLTTYNTVPSLNDYLNNNITIRNNYIDGSNASVQTICYGVALEGNGIIIDNNTILYGGEVIITQWGGANINNVTISNNIIPDGHTYVSFKNTTAYGNVINNAYLSNVNAYNNTFETAIISDYDNLTNNNFEYLTFDSSQKDLTNNNNITNLNITGSNNNIHDLKFTNLTITGDSNNITNTQSEYVLISGNNNTFSNNYINSSYEYAIAITGQSNTITNNSIYSLTKAGDNAVYTTTTNNIENNTPLNNETFIITDENYSQFFDENGLINENLIPKYANITLNGAFNNKDFKFKENIYTINGNETILYNTTIIINDSQIVIDNITINNTNIPNAIIVNSNNSILKNLKIYSENTNDIDAVILNGDNIEFTLNTINITTTKDVTAIKVNQNDSNTIQNNTIYIKGNEVVAINVNGSKVTNHMENNKILINATKALGILVNADNISNNNFSYTNMTIKAQDTATGIIIDNNEYALNNYFYRVVITANAENTSFIKINQQNKTCENTSFSLSWFNSNASNVIGLDLIGDNYHTESTLYVNINATNSVTGTKISGINNTIGFNSNITGSNSKNDLFKSQLIYVYDSQKFKLAGGNHYLINSTAIVLNNTTDSNVTNQNINIDGEGVGCTLYNVTNTRFDSDTFNTDNPIIIIDSDNNNFRFLTFNNNATLILNNSKNIIFNRTNFNSDEFTIIELEESNTLYSSNTFGSNMKLTLKNSTLTENKINNITLIDSSNIDVSENTINETLNIINSNFININNNTINTTNEYTVILDNSTQNTTVKRNILYAMEKTGDNSILNNNPSNTIQDNAPEDDIILTDDNYNQYFDENSMIIKETPFINIKLGSDLYNKDLTFIQKTNISNPDNYTLYNSTITFTENSTDNYVNNLIIKNIDKEYALILNGITKINNTEIYNGTIISSKSSSISNTINNTIIKNTDDRISSVIGRDISIYYSAIYQENNNNQAKVIDGSVVGYSNITLNGNGTVVVFNNPQSFSYNNITVNSSNTTVLSIKNLTGHLNINYNNINVTSENKAVVMDIQTHSSIKIENNNITTNTVQGITPLIIIKEATSIDTTSSVKNNYIKSIDLTGNRAVTKNINVTISGNTPQQTLTIVLTDDNYNELFEDDLFIFDADIIELGSNLYNKNLIFDQTIELTNPNNFTIYNGTITLNNAKNIRITHININNTDKPVLLINDTSVTFSENNIYTQSNNQELIVLNTPNLKSTLTKNNLTAIGNNNTLFALYLNNLISPSFSNNNMTIVGDDNFAIYAANTNTKTTISSNTIIVNSNKASTPLLFAKAAVTFQKNTVIVNTTQNGVPIVILNYTKGDITNNYLESLDLVGNDAAEGYKQFTTNTPTTTGYISKLDYITLPQEIVVNQENTLTITPTDVFGREINGTITITDDENTYTTGNNTITYISNTTGQKTLTITYTDPTGKYNTTTITKTLTVTPPTLTIDPITATIGQTINIVARITAGTETITDINKGKVTFKVNGKTLKDENGKVIYAKLVNGTATIENYIVPEEWSKEGSTIEAVYSGSTQCDKLTSEKTNITVEKAVPTLTTSDVTAAAGETITLTATITDNDKVINNGKIVFKINGKTVKDANGKVIYAKVVNNQVSVEYTLPADMKAKDYNITATFISNDYERIEDTKTLTITA